MGILGGVGQRYPAHATAVGKALLAHLPQDELDRRLEGKRLERLTHRTIVDPTKLAEDLSRVRANGYAVDDEERGIGIRCVAVPIFDHNGVVRSALSLSGPIFHLTADAVEGYSKKLMEVCGEISARLGYEAVR